MNVIPESHMDLLERPLFAHFATSRVDGWPQVNPMWFAWTSEPRVTREHHERWGVRVLRHARQPLWSRARRRLRRRHALPARITYTMRWDAHAAPRWPPVPELAV